MDLYIYIYITPKHDTGRTLLGAELEEVGLAARGVHRHGIGQVEGVDRLLLLLLLLGGVCVFVCALWTRAVIYIHTQI